MGIKVCKFGGTSMADGAAIDNVAGIVLSDCKRRYVVVSAPGKRAKEDEKVTDLLYKCCDEVRTLGNCDESFGKIRQRFVEIVSSLGLKFDIIKVLDETQEKIVALKGDRDFAASRGEYLNARIMAARLDYEFVDAAEIVKFDVEGNFDSEYTNDLCRKRFAKVKNAVVPGFYGSLPDGKIKTFSRGGSDITGAIVARAVEAELYENWTDVDGFMTCDPRIVENPKVIDVLSYKELRELAYMGASVLHAEAIFPVSTSGIPINIKNTFQPSAKGTMIVPLSKYFGASNIITGIAGLKDFSVIFIDKSMMNSELGFARKVLTILEHNGISFEHMPTGIDTLSLVISSDQLKDGMKEKLVNRITGACSPDHITVVEDMALIAIVGHGMKAKKGTVARLCNAVAGAGINIRMIDQGSSELNIIVGVDNADYENAIKAIYKEFF